MSALDRPTNVFRLRSLGGQAIYEFRPLAAGDALVHGVTARPINLAAHRGPACEHASDHRRRLCEALGLDFNRLTSARQVHGAEVLVVEAALAGVGRGSRDGTEPAADALATIVPGVVLLMLSADCPLVLLFDPTRPAVGVAHASWRGTLAGVTARLAATMRQRFRCDPSAMIAGLAPSAGPCCYEVGMDVVEAAAASGVAAREHVIHRDGRCYFDLWSANRAQLLAGGIPASAIHCAGICTLCDTRFFSHRREGPTTGRFGLIAALRP